MICGPKQASIMEGKEEAISKQMAHNSISFFLGQVGVLCRLDYAVPNVWTRLQLE